MLFRRRATTVDEHERLVREAELGAVHSFEIAADKLVSRGANLGKRVTIHRSRGGAFDFAVARTGAWEITAIDPVGATDGVKVTIRAI